MNDERRPDWAHLVTRDESWHWKDQRLFHRHARTDSTEIQGAINPGSRSWIRSMVLKYVYATQNRSGNVKGALSKVLGTLGSDGWGVNLGAGGVRLNDRVLNIDLFDGEGIDIVTHGSELPFDTGTVDLAISQEVLEHIANPDETVSELHRVLKPGGYFYCQIPFIIGYHPGPTDFWRFTKEGVVQLFANQDWEVGDVCISLGHGSGFYRIAVEYVAVSFSIFGDRAYLGAKALAALILLPLKLPDCWTGRCSQKDRIPGGYFCIVRKKVLTSLEAS